MGNRWIVEDVEGQPIADQVMVTIRDAETGVRHRIAVSLWDHTADEAVTVALERVAALTDGGHG